MVNDKINILALNVFQISNEMTAPQAMHLYFFSVSGMSIYYTALSNTI